MYIQTFTKKALMKKYYTHNGTNQEGPFSIDDLREKKIAPETQIWYEGISDWKQAKNISELNKIFKKGPPPFKKEKTTSPKSKEKD